MSMEHIIPHEDRLNTSLELFRGLLDESIAEVSERQEGDIVAVDTEFDSIFSIRVFRRVAVALDRLSDDDNETRVYSIYRGIIFGYGTACAIYGDSIEVDFGYIDREYLSTTNTEFAKERYTTDVQDYLSANPEVDALIGSYVDDIDQGRGSLSEVELAVGLIFMLAEQQVAENYVAQSIDRVSPEMFDN